MLPAELAGVERAAVARARRHRSGSDARTPADGGRLPRAARGGRPPPGRARHRRGLAEPARGVLARGG